MLTVSLHGIRIHAPFGLYVQEHMTGNDFEVDVDLSVAVSPNEDWPLKDYTQINTIVHEAFAKEEQLLEALVKNIHQAIRQRITGIGKAKVTIRKLNPPMPGYIKYAQVSYEG